MAGTLGWFSADEALGYDRFGPLVSHGLTRLVLFAAISLTLFHFAHRFRFTLADLGLRAARRPIGVLCYGAAIAVTVWAAYLLGRSS